MYSVLRYPLYICEVTVLYSTTLARFFYLILWITGLLFLAKTLSGEPASDVENFIQKLTSVNKVNITIKGQLVDKKLVQYYINTQEDIESLNQAFPQFVDNITLIIQKQKYVYLTFDLNRNSRFLSPAFSCKYFTKDGKEQTRRGGACVRNQSLSHCYFTGYDSTSKSSLSSISLCKGAKGVINLANQTFLLKPIFRGDKVIHILSKKHFDDESQPLTCGTEIDNISFTKSEHSRRRASRQVRLPAGYSASTRYLELYMIMDHSLYLRTGSVSATIERAIDIANYGNVMYRKLDIYLVLVGVEVWNTENKIPYINYPNDTISIWANKLLDSLQIYRRNVFSRHSRNDNAQLLTASKLQKRLIGLASTLGICTETASTGIIYDRKPDDYLDAASTMIHEIGHNLGMYHSNSIGKVEECACEYPDDEEYTYCIMNSFASKYLNLIYTY